MTRETSTAVSHLDLPPWPAYVTPALEFLDSFATGLGILAGRLEHLKMATRIGLELVLENNRVSGRRVGLDISEDEGMIRVEVINHGIPLFLNGNPRFHEAAKHIDQISIENHGREGQRVCLRMRLGEAAARRAMEKALAVAPLELSEEEVELRELRPGEEASLSQLFYFVYGYDYIHEFVYYPEKLRQMREEGKLISIVAALPSGRLVAHVGLIQWNDHPRVFEPCLGVTDPGMKSRGLFSKVFAETMRRVREIPMQYCFFDFVTNHELSQRFVAKYEPADLALFVGCQSKDTQARLEKLGMGSDPKETDRYSLLYSIIPRARHPFGQEIRLPNNLGELLGFLLEPLNLSWVPSPRFEQLPENGEYQTHLQPAQSAVTFDIVRPGRQAVERLIDQWRSLLRTHYEYGAVEIAVDWPGIGPLYDLLAEHGFFVSGFVPYHYSDRLALRFQALGPTKVSFEEIKVFTPTAKRLLEIVRATYERNQVL